MKKSLIALAVAAALAIAGSTTYALAGSPDTKGTYPGETKIGVEYKADGSQTHWWKRDNEDGSTDYLWENWELNDLDNLEKVSFGKVNPSPDSDNPYAGDTPPGHKDGNPLVLGNGEKVDPSVLKWTPELENTLGGGFAIQGKGGRNEVINPDPFGSSGRAPKKPKTEDEGDDKSKLDPNQLGQKLAESEELFNEQFPGIDLALSNVGYIQLHNPAESQKQGGGEVGGPAPGGGSPPPAPAGAAKADSSDNTGGKAPPNLKDAAVGALINPDPFASNVAEPQGNQGMGLPAGLDQPGGGGGAMQPPGAGAGASDGSAMNGAGTGTGSGHTGSTSRPNAGNAHVPAMQVPNILGKAAADAAKRRRNALAAAAQAKRKRQAAEIKAVKARRRASYAAKKNAAARARRAVHARKAVWAKRKRATAKLYVQPKRHIAVAPKRRTALSNARRMRVIRLR